MNKFAYKQFNETYYEDKCDNGLKIVVWHKPLFNTTSCLFGTPFGSFDINQITADRKTYHFEKGIAHFLEHKLFESANGDVLSQFSTLGANVNAFTSYKETVYYFSTSDADVSVPLNLLLDFVQDLNISEESVEKEKGIIIQELMMYLQNPDSRIYFETFKGMYHYYPLKDDIGGDEKSVTNISKQALEDCYNLNYHPSNMLVVVVTHQDPQKIIDIIKNNQNKKRFKPFSEIKTVYDDEPLNVKDAYKEIKMDINETKCCLGIKLPVIDENDFERVKKDWMFNLSLEAYFSGLNPKYQTWIDEKRITSYFSFEEDLGKGHSYLLFNDHNENPQAFKEFILKELENFKKTYLDEETLKMLKNRNLGQLIRGFNRPENMSVAYFREYYNGVSLFENLNMISDITAEECFEFINNLDFSNNCLTVIKNAVNE